MYGNDKLILFDGVIIYNITDSRTIVSVLKYCSNEIIKLFLKTFKIKQEHYEIITDKNNQYEKLEVLNINENDCVNFRIFIENEIYNA